MSVQMRAFQSFNLTHYLKAFNYNKNLIKPILIENKNLVKRLQYVFR